MRTFFLSPPIAHFSIARYLRSLCIPFCTSIHSIQIEIDGENYQNNLSNLVWESVCVREREREQHVNRHQFIRIKCQISCANCCE